MRGAHQGGCSVAVGQFRMRITAVRMLIASPTTVIRLGATHIGNRLTTLHTYKKEPVMMLVDWTGTVPPH